MTAEGARAKPSLDDGLLLPVGKVSLADYATDATPGADDDSTAGKRRLEKLRPELLENQTKLFAHGRTGGNKRVLLVLQGMDTAGKGGVLIHTIGLLDPQAVRIASFAKPTAEELRHDFLWRVERVAPQPGYVGVFDRSHYEDVLVGRVRQLAPADEIERRYDAINDFERRLVDDGTVVLKCMLHISAAEQKRRLQARLDDPTKYWKYDPGDIDERQLWDQYVKAYEVALERTNTDYAPWHIVPSDKKWYRNLAVGSLLLDVLVGLGLNWPSAQFDVAREQQRLTEDTIS